MSDTARKTITGQQPTAEVHRLDIAHSDGDVYAVDIRDHRLLVDQPEDAGGTDTAPTPTELFAASLGTCVAFYAGRYLHRHGLERTGLRVRLEFTMARDLPARVASMSITIKPPPGLPDERRPALLAVASHCTVHNTLRQPPEIAVELEP
ncbi:OsmC family protein [Streptomyces sp. TRM49041]|uniref:OsmC family protein n=1 Tax=Streptomyces sp. TRM49041 TaxID=2603216 RepID=UPI0011ED1EA2|nr:OsmC family protein [Streptomyces sp. TRM49041]